MFSCLLYACLVARRTDVNAPCHLHSHRIHRQSSQFWVRALAMLRTKSEYDLLSGPFASVCLCSMCGKLMRTCICSVCCDLSQEFQELFLFKNPPKKNHHSNTGEEKTSILKQERTADNQLCYVCDDLLLRTVLCCAALPVCRICLCLCIYFLMRPMPNGHYSLVMHTLTHTHGRMQSAWLENERTTCTIRCVRREWWNGTATTTTTINKIAEPSPLVPVTATTKATKQHQLWNIKASKKQQNNIFLFMHSLRRRRRHDRWSLSVRDRICVCVCVRSIHISKFIAHLLLWWCGCCCRPTKNCGHWQGLRT